MTTPSDLETLLRTVALDYGHIQLFRDANGWQASVCHYEPRRDVHDGIAIADPVDALRAALIEDDRQARDLERRYAEAPKVGDTASDIEDWELA